MTASSHMKESQQPSTTRERAGPQKMATEQAEAESRLETSPKHPKAHKKMGKNHKDVKKANVRAYQKNVSMTILKKKKTEAKKCRDFRFRHFPPATL